MVGGKILVARDITEVSSSSVDLSSLLQRSRPSLLPKECFLSTGEWWTSRRIKPEHCQDINIDVVGGHPCFFCCCSGFVSARRSSRLLRVHRTGARSCSAPQAHPAGPADSPLHVLLGMVAPTHQRKGIAITYYVNIHANDK